MARAVGERDQPDDAGLPAAGRLLNGHRGLPRKGAAPIAAPDGAREYASGAQAGNGTEPAMAAAANI